MTTFKLPEPVELSSPQDERAIYGYTEAQLKQALRDVIEMAAQECEEYLHRDYAGTVLEYGPDLPANQQMMNCIDAIRKMIGEI